MTKEHECNFGGDKSIEDWCACNKWQSGAWRVLMNFAKMNFCPFCGNKLEKLEKVTEET